MQPPAGPRPTSLRLAIDIGGTFTDVVLVDERSGALTTLKTPTTPADPAVGFFDGLEAILASQPAPRAGAEGIGAVLHGSTIATNAVLEGKGARTGLIVTAGFKYVLEIGRHEIPRKENLFVWLKPKRPVPPRFILEVPERVLADGTVARPLDEDAVCRAAAELAARGIEAIGIVFLHAYANPAHERRARELVREACPGLAVSLSSEVLPVFREYERSMATVLNAAVEPLVGAYVGRIAQGLERRGVAAPLLIMKSNGGMTGPSHLSRQAIGMALSGPAAGVVGAARLAAAAGFPDAVTIDIGGTSADVSLIRGGEPTITTEGEIGPFPLALPIIDIHTIGAGGGSVAAVTGTGALVVGPQSAGAVPGPACYGRGGTRPTVTDAHALLGRLPEALLAGGMVLDLARARAALAAGIAAPLGLADDAAAEGVITVVNGAMTGALKVVSVERGVDPRGLALVAFGGAGPLHAVELGRELGSGTVIVPRHPGLMCALGLLSTDIRTDHARTVLQRPGAYDAARLAAVFDALAEEAHAELAREGIPPARRRLVRLVDLRYAKQGFELTLPFGDGPVDEAALARLVEAFHDRHEQLYTFAERDSGVEIVTLRIASAGLVEKVALPELAPAAGTLPQPVGARRVRLDGAWIDRVPVFARPALRGGHRLGGPAIVDQADATTVIPPGHAAEVDRFGNLVITAVR